MERGRVRVNVAMPEGLWRRLRDIAEVERQRGPASVSRAIVRILQRALDRTTAGEDHGAQGGLR